MVFSIMVRSQLLLHYFGEDNSTACGLCDVCLEHAHQRNAAGDNLDTVAQSIIALLHDQPMQAHLIAQHIHAQHETIAEALRRMSDTGHIAMDDMQRFHLPHHKK